MATETNVNRTTALQAVERIRPVIEQYRDEAERDRNLPAPVVEAMQHEGLLDLWLPKEFGGVELPLPDYLEVVQALSAIDSAAGWVFTIIATGGFQAALLPEAGAHEVYDPKPLTAGSIVPRGRAIPVEGGYRVSGRWPLASGSMHSAWLGANCLVFEGDTPRMGPGGMPDFTLMYLPASECKILDTWNSTGMRGTGSHDFVAEDVFVPAHRCFPLFASQSHVAGDLYKIRLEMVFLMALSCVGLGVARSAIDAFVAIAKEKTPTLSQTGLAARPTVHAELARTEAVYQSAKAYMQTVAGEMMNAVTTGEMVPEELEARRRLACNHAAAACEEVVDRMYRLAGTSAIQAGSALDRCLRDIHTLNQHLAVSPVWWEKTGQYYFGYGLGMP